MKGQQEFNDDRNLSNKERNKIIEVLMSQERVLTLLYDKTFPPRANQQNPMLNQLQGRNMHATESA